MSAQRSRNKQIRNVDNQIRNINDQMLNINNTPTSTITTTTSSSNTPTVQGAEMQEATQLKSQMSALVSLTSALHITRSDPDSGLRGGRIGRGGGGGGGGGGRGRGAEAQPAQDITMPMSQLSALVSMISAMNITRPSSDFGPGRGSDSDLGGGSGLGEGGQGEQGGGNVISPSYVAAVKSISSGIDTVAAMILAAIDLNLTLQRRLHPQPQQPQQPQSQLHYRSASGSGPGVISIEIDTGMDFSIEDSKDEHEDISLIKTMTKTMGEYGKFLKMTANDLRETAAALTEAANNYRNHHTNDNSDYSDNDYNHKHTVSLLLKQFLEESGSFERMFVEYTEIMRPRMATWN
ncbi:hypothetical protein BGX24_011199 [Mortierella sp. AD032]|nr:hypothetical protein BGX24_011199 [Mortierella sp. AD032]